MSSQEVDFAAKMNSIGFRPDARGLAMEANISGVHVTAMEGPLGIHLVFVQVSARTTTRFEVTAPISSTAQQIAAVIVANIESAFPDSQKETVL